MESRIAGAVMYVSQLHAEHWEAGLRFWAEGLEMRLGFSFRVGVQGSWFRAQGLGFTALGFGLRAWWDAGHSEYTILARVPLQGLILSLTSLAQAADVILLSERPTFTHLEETPCRWVLNLNPRRKPLTIKSQPREHANHRLKREAQVPACWG